MTYSRIPQRRFSHEKATPRHLSRFASRYKHRKTQTARKTAQKARKKLRERLVHERKLLEVYCLLLAGLYLSNLGFMRKGKGTRVICIPWTVFFPRQTLPNIFKVSLCHQNKNRLKKPQSPSLYFLGKQF